MPNAGLLALLRAALLVAGPLSPALAWQGLGVTWMKKVLARSQALGIAPVSKPGLASAPAPTSSSQALGPALASEPGRASAPAPASSSQALGPTPASESSRASAPAPASRRAAQNLTVAGLNVTPGSGGRVAAVGRDLFGDGQLESMLRKAPAEVLKAVRWLRAENAALRSQLRQAPEPKAAALTFAAPAPPPDSSLVRLKPSEEAPAAPGVDAKLSLAREDCDVSQWSEWTACSGALTKPGVADLARRERTVKQQGTAECPYAVEFKACGNAGTFGILLNEKAYWRTTAQPPYVTTTAGPELTMRPLPPGFETVEIEPPEEDCIMTDWSEWSGCIHHRKDYKIKAAMRTRQREVVAVMNNATGCPATEDIMICTNEGPIAKIIYDFH